MSQLLPQEIEATAKMVQADDSRAGDERPVLLRDKSFWGMLVTQFLGAFNDNLYKQLMLLLAIPVGMTAASMQGWATFVFSLPFVLFSGLAGYLSDRYSKTPIIVYCKVAEIVVMLLGLLAFHYYDLFGQPGTWVVLFLMGLQSTFFGPGKYGVLPELFRPGDLPRANGLMLMTTFLAIIFGTVFAGTLKKLLAGDGAEAEAVAGTGVAGMWPAMVICIAIAVVGTLTAMLVRRTPAAQPTSRLTIDSWGVSRDMWQLLSSDRPLLYAVLASSVFWLISGMAVPTVNRLGLDMLKLNAEATSALTASIAFGIMGGAVLASYLCRKGWGDRSVTWGLLGIFGCLLLLGIARQVQPGQFTPAVGLIGSIVGLLALGVCAAVFAIPVQVFLQDRPPAALKGRMIATMNQANFVGILISGPLYQVFEKIVIGQEWPLSTIFWMMAVLVLPVALLYRLNSKQAPAELEAAGAS